MKVTFFNGTRLDPVPPEASKDPDARYLHVHEDGAIDEEKVRSWVRQAAAQPGWGASRGPRRCSSLPAAPVGTPGS